MTEEPTGILNPAAIDAITTGDDGIVELHIEQTAPWDGTDHLLLLTQEKLWNYLAYVADGDLVSAHPHAVRGWQVVFEEHEEPDRRTVELLQRAGEQFRRLGGALVTRRMPADR
jgi:Family of unknown function (DUF6572)